LKLYIDCRLGCGERVSAVDREVHESSTCDCRIVNCNASDVGCAWKGMFRDLAAHEAYCSVISVRPAISNLMNIIQAQQHQLNMQQQQMVVLNFLAGVTTSLSDTDLSYRDLSHRRFSGIEMKRCSLVGSKLNQFVDCELYNCDFTRSKSLSFKKCRFYDCDLREAIYSADDDCIFDNCKLDKPKSIIPKVEKRVDLQPQTSSQTQSTSSSSTQIIPFYVIESIVSSKPGLDLSILVTMLQVQGYKLAGTRAGGSVRNYLMQYSGLVLTPGPKGMCFVTLKNQSSVNNNNAVVSTTNTTQQPVQRVPATVVTTKKVNLPPPTTTTTTSGTIIRKQTYEKLDKNITLATLKLILTEERPVVDIGVMGQWVYQKLGYKHTKGTSLRSILSTFQEIELKPGPKGRCAISWRNK
jgi:uncharacterized protein YjbI with pentapeptide repeats